MSFEEPFCSILFLRSDQDMLALKACDIYMPNADRGYGMKRLWFGCMIEDFMPSFISVKKNSSLPFLEVLLCRLFYYSNSLIEDICEPSACLNWAVFAF